MSAIFVLFLAGFAGAQDKAVRIVPAKTAPGKISAAGVLSPPLAPSPLAVSGPPVLAAPIPSLPAAAPVAPVAPPVAAVAGDAGIGARGERAMAAARADAGALASEAAASEDAAAAAKYIRGIMGSRRPTERETEALLDSWLDARDIRPASERAQRLRAALLPEASAAESRAAAALSPALKPRAAVLLKVSAERGLPLTELERVALARGLERIGQDAAFAAQLDIALNAAALQKAVAAYPDSDAGRLMRGVAAWMGSRSGKSVEEIGRDGVFVYADFRDSRAVRPSAGRDPDDRSRDAVFYVQRKDGAWTLGGYRQNRPAGRTDRELGELLLKWLSAGGVRDVVVR